MKFFKCGIWKIDKTNVDRMDKNRINSRNKCKMHHQMLNNKKIV